MKICSISRIKNEEDIIETFIRYHLNFIDEMIIFEDNSSDETYNILSNLKKENLPIHIFRNTKKHSEQQKVINIALDKAINYFNADLVVTLDTDEFLVNSTGGNPRDTLESLDKNKYYKIQWRTYLPNLESNIFSLDDLTTIRDPKIDNNLFKVIIPLNIYEKYDFEIKKGNHDLKSKETIPFEISKNLRIAHIPIRSKKQCISKEVIAWLYNVSSYYKSPKNSWHQNEMFQLIKKSNGQLSDENLIKYAKSYSSVNDKTNVINEVKQPFDTKFCKNMELKYTKHETFKVVSNILEFCENMAIEYGKLHQTMENMNEDILINSNTDKSYLTLLEEAYTQVKKQLYFKENEIIDIHIAYKRNINHKNDKIKKLTEKLKDYNKVKSLNSKLTKVNARKDKEIKSILTQKDEEITAILNEKNYMKKIIEEKNNQIEILEEKIRIMNSIR